MTTYICYETGEDITDTMAFIRRHIIRRTIRWTRLADGRIAIITQL